MDLGLSIHFEYMEEESDHRKCEECKNIIFGKMYAQIIFVDSEPTNLETAKRYCEACYSAEEE